MSDLTQIKTDSILKPFFDRYPDFDLLKFDFFNTEAVEALNWEGLDKDTICDRLKAYQRLLRLGLDPSDAKKLLDASQEAVQDEGEEVEMLLLASPEKSRKLDSAIAIASTSEAEFVQNPKLDPEKAREFHRSATQRTAGSMVLLANAMQFSSPRLGTMLADNAAQVREKFQSLPSYQKLFGSLDYLQCDPCQSIFSPAAYFVDLMRIVEQYIAQVNKGNQGFSGLSDRRPDLEKILLTCDNTNDSVPYTQIVSEVLAEKLKKELGEGDVFKYLAIQAKYPHNLPFNLYLEQVRLYLGHLNANLATIYQTFHPQEPHSTIWAREYLGLSIEEYNLVITASTGNLSDRYGVNVSPTDLGGLTKKATFLKQTGLSDRELKDLFYQNLSSEEVKFNLAHQFYINKKLSDNKYLKLNERGEIENLNLETLDRVDRFLRLTRKLGWSFADLDFVLTSIKVEDINETAIQKIAQIKQLQLQTKLPLDVLCSFWYDMKAIGKGDNPNCPQDLFDRVFNNPLILQGQENDPKLANDWKISNLNTDEDKESSRLTRSRLLAALQLSDRDLTDIVEKIGQTEIKLDLANLSIFFRISQILKLLRLKLGEYDLVLNLLKQFFDNKELFKIDKKLEIWEFIEIIEFAQWLKVSGFSLYELDYILNGTVHPSVEVLLPEEKMAFFIESLREKVQFLKDQLQDEHKSKKLTEEEIKIEPEKTKSLKDELQEKVALLLGIEPGLFSVLAKLASQTGKAQDFLQLLLTQVQTKKNDWEKIVGCLIECLKVISRMRLLVSKLDLTETELRSISHRPQSYNIESLANLTVKDIENLYKCKNQLVRIFSNSQGDLAKYFEDPSVENLDKLTGWKAEQIQKANDFLKTEPKANELYNSVEGLLKLKQCFDLCATLLGCNIDFLCDLSELLKNGSVADNWDKYQKVARSVISLAKAKYDSEEWAKVFGKLNGTLEERKCKVLTDFALQKLGRENPRQLSEYLLLDVEMTSCACNSQIQLAILSVQTYLQRCRMGMEPGVTQVNISAVWWEWIMNYRIWEANRKVFLYPENYIDPSLRKNASPIFKELQDELLQSEITAETVEAAYRNYFDKFAELANLQIVEGCRYSVQTPKNDKPIDTLFIFAKTITQPHTFYYRRCEQPTANKPLWGYWEKIDLQINSDYLASVYAFNRLFVFWVETKEIKKSHEQPSTTQATIKYSFLNASQKWVSPQILVADVEIPSKSDEPATFNLELDTNFWQQIYPTVFPESDLQPELITTVFGGLQSVLASEFDKKQRQILDARTQIMFGLNAKFSELKATIANDLLPSSTIFRSNNLKLTKARSWLAATTVGNLAIFAGGESPYSDVVDVFKCDSQGNLEKIELNPSIKLTQARSSLAATTVGNLAIFAGGEDRYGDVVDVFKYDTQGNLEKIELNPSIKLTQARGYLAATTVGNLAIFAGGQGWSDVVDVFKYDSQGNLEKIELNPSIKLTEGCRILAATTVKNLAIFAGGYNSKQGNIDVADVVNVFKYDSQGNLERIELNPSIKLTQARGSLVATTVGNLAIFASGNSDVVEVFNACYLSPTFSALPKTAALTLPIDTTVTPIKNQPQSFIFQRRSEAFSLMSGQASDLTRLTTSSIHQLSHTLFAKGLDGLLSLESQQISEPDFPRVSNNQLDFDGAYGAYFWEIFFHIPFLIASTLNAHQRYNEARQWYQYIFNPTIPSNKNDKDKERFWRFLPFRGQTPEKLKDILTNEGAIQAYKENPFDPHAIARLRIGAYEKAVVMKYIDNLLNWGDALFTQDNWESITHATTLYLLAYDLLGPKPKNLGKPPTPEPKTFAQIKAGAKGNISDFLIDLETPEYQEFIKQFGDAVPFNALDAYFCVSENQEFAQYWDRVEDRLFKIRHCQNIKGIERQLALFQPPIDPMQLVRQAAAGDGGISLSLTDSVPHYRFSHLLERAKGMASTVIQLGSTLLNTLEKKDAEELALLRATQEPVLLQMITKTKEKQIQEAEANLTSLQRSLEAASDRSKYYQNLLAGGWNAEEKATVALMGAALVPQIYSSAIRASAIPGYLAPKIFGLAAGGMEFGDAINMAAAMLDSSASVLNQSASLASTVAQFQRRKEDWEFQQQMAQWDFQQIETQIAAAKVRVDLAKAEIDVHHKSIEQSRQVEQFFKDKFTNKDLYQWMVGRLSGLYFQTYKIALEMAYSTQKAYQYELNKDDTYLQSIYWDSYKKGLLAGESLMLGLNQLEKAYLDGSARRLEIEKIISLRQLAPEALDKLKTEGSCKFSFNEKLFALDFPSHYCRQIKTISVSIPAVVGPYQNINATLTQTSNKVLIKNDGDAKATVKWLLDRKSNPPASGTLRQDWRNNQQIAISKGANDSGLFVLNFQDDRYLPFEGTGAISDWILAMPPKAKNQIDFVDSITDVIITLSYTALDGGSTIRDAVAEELK